MNQINMPMDCHAWDVMLEIYERYIPKPTKIAQLKLLY